MSVKTTLVFHVKEALEILYVSVLNSLFCVRVARSRSMWQIIDYVLIDPKM